MNKIVCVLRFLYGVTLGQNTVQEHIPYAREPRQLPVVLSSDEVVEFMQAVSSSKSRVALTTAYVAGARVSEVCGLRANDIDRSRMVIHIARGKGGRARYVMLLSVPELLGILRSYWRLARPKDILFPGRDADKPIEPWVLHSACRLAVAAAGLSKQVTSSAAATIASMVLPATELPDVIDALKAMVLAMARQQADSEDRITLTQARLAASKAEVARLKAVEAPANERIANLTTIMNVLQRTQNCR